MTKICDRCGAMILDRLDNKQSKVWITNGRGEYRFIEASEIPSLKGSDWKVIAGNGTCFVPQ